MKNEIAASTTIAPIPTATALPPLRPVSLEEPPLVPETVGVTGVAGAVGVVGGCCGIPGANGLLGVAAPTAPEANNNVVATTATTTAAGPHRERPPQRERLPLGEWLLHRGCLWSIAVGLLVLDILLVIHAFGVDGPDVVT